MSVKKAAPTPEEIAVHAYFIYESEGYSEGRAWEHWLQAEIQLMACKQHEEWTNGKRQSENSVE